LSLPILHLVTGDEVAGRSDFPPLARRLFEAYGSDLALHLRLKRAAGSRFFRLARDLSGMAERTGGWCAVNERLDVALAAGAQAVQLGHTALPVAVALKVIRASAAASAVDGGAVSGASTAGDAVDVPPKRSIAIGASVHGEPEARRAVADGANFLILGTIFSSRSHPGVRPHGTAIVERCRDLGVPLIAIGGVDESRVPELKRLGASGIAVVGAVWGAGDPFEAAGTLIEVWKAS
jgi:thiamine-phosphate pyrophosphorylase